jgi:hypothetical protein
MDDVRTSLTGGRVTSGIVRIGQTVRRPVSGDRTPQRELLACLHDRGFTASPRFLGIDEKGREVLSFLPGEVPSDLGHFSDSQIAAAASLLRRFHDATVDFPAVRREGAEVMCHNDWGPTNSVFESGVPHAIIDFDTIAPGPRLWDLGYSAWLWLDVGNPEYTADEQLRRLAVFVDTYGVPVCSAVHTTAYMIARQAALATQAKTCGASEMATWAATSAEWTVSSLLEPLLASSRPK